MNELTKQLSEILACPVCHGPLDGGDGINCARCGVRFAANKHGYQEFRVAWAPEENYGLDVTSGEYAEKQETGGDRMYREYLKPLLSREPFERVLDVGCGVGSVVRMFLDDGSDAYGVDLPPLSGFWKRAENSPLRFFACDATSLPFPSDFFDVVVSLGVIEHIGTVTGHYTLRGDYREIRRRYAKEILRVTKRGGRILIAAPNKKCPFDIQHGPTDDGSPKTLVNKIRNVVHSKTKVTVHQTWGDYCLPSHEDVRKYFIEDGGGSAIEALPIKNYFGFGRFESGPLKLIKTLVNLYVDNLPARARTSFLNPYVMALIRK